MAGRPYFLWDYDLSDEQVRAILRGENEAERARLITRILKRARWEDISRDLPRLHFRRPQDRELWAYALARWGCGWRGVRTLAGNHNLQR